MNYLKKLLLGILSKSVVWEYKGDMEFPWDEVRSKSIRNNLNDETTVSNFQWVKTYVEHVEKHLSLIIISRDVLEICLEIYRKFSMMYSGDFHSGDKKTSTCKIPVWRLSPNHLLIKQLDAINILLQYTISCLESEIPNLSVSNWIICWENDFKTLSTPSTPVYCSLTLYNTVQYLICIASKWLSCMRAYMTQVGSRSPATAERPFWNLS